MDIDDVKKAMEAGGHLDPGTVLAAAVDAAGEQGLAADFVTEAMKSVAPDEKVAAATAATEAAMKSVSKEDKAGVAQSAAEAAVNAVPDEEKAGVAQAAAAAAVSAVPDDLKVGVATAAAEAAVGAVAEADKKDVAQAAVALVPEGDRAAVLQQAVQAVPQADRKAVAQAAVENLNANDLKSLREEAFPQDSGDRLWVFLVGFLVSGTVVVALSLIAWAAQGAEGNSPTSTSILVLGTAFTSAMLGGMLGAYKGG